MNGQEGQDFANLMGRVVSLGLRARWFVDALIELVAAGEARYAEEQQIAEESLAEAGEFDGSLEQKAGRLFPKGDIRNWGMFGSNDWWCIVENDGTYEFCRNREKLFEVHGGGLFVRETSSGRDTRLILAKKGGGFVRWENGVRQDFVGRFVRVNKDGDLEYWWNGVSQGHFYRLAGNAESEWAVGERIDGVVTGRDDFPIVLRGEKNLMLVSPTGVVRKWQDFQAGDGCHSRHVNACMPIYEDGALVDLALIVQSTVYRTRADGPPMAIGRVETTHEYFSAFWNGEPWWLESDGWSMRRLHSTSRVSKQFNAGFMGGVQCYMHKDHIILLTRHDGGTSVSRYDGNAITSVRSPCGDMRVLEWPIVTVGGSKRGVFRWNGKEFEKVVDCPEGLCVDVDSILYGSMHGTRTMYGIVVENGRVLVTEPEAITTDEMLSIRDAVLLADRALVIKHHERRMSYTDGTRQYGKTYNGLGQPWEQDGHVCFYAYRRRQPWLVRVPRN
jgi:hypothetical protein